MPENASHLDIHSMTFHLKSLEGWSAKAWLEDQIKDLPEDQIFLAFPSWIEMWEKTWMALWEVYQAANHPKTCPETKDLQVIFNVQQHWFASFHGEVSVFLFQRVPASQRTEMLGSLKDFFEQHVISKQTDISHLTIPKFGPAALQRAWGEGVQTMEEWLFVLTTLGWPEALAVGLSQHRCLQTLSNFQSLIEQLNTLFPSLYNLPNMAYGYLSFVTTPEQCRWVLDTFFDSMPLNVPWILQNWAHLELNRVSQLLMELEKSHCFSPLEDVCAVQHFFNTHAYQILKDVSNNLAPRTPLSQVLDFKIVTDKEGHYSTWVHPWKQQQVSPSTYPELFWIPKDYLQFWVRHFQWLDVTDERGWSALHIEALSQNLSQVLMLLEMGANPFAKTQEGLTPRQLLDVHVQIQVHLGHTVSNSKYEAIRVALEKAELQACMPGSQANEHQKRI